MTIKKPHLNFSLLVFILTITNCRAQDYNLDLQYSQQQLQTDFQFLRTKLENTHPALYLYTSKIDMDAYLDSLYQMIRTPKTEREFYNVITLLNSKIKDGHTMFLPGEKAVNYFNEHTGFFPFYIVIQTGKLYVNMNCSADTTITAGDEIVGINDTYAKTIIDYLLQRQIRDGNNSTYPEWILTTYFKSYYGFSFGHASSFIVNVRNDKGESKATTINALSNDSIRFFKEKKYAGRIPGNNVKKGINLEVDKQSSIATLTIPSFNNDVLKSTYNQYFKTEIEKHFQIIKQSGMKHLIVDLRNNQGGDWEPGRLLLSYLIEKPVKYLENSAQSKMVDPKDNNFTGDLYVLINGGSFSNSGIVSSCLEQAGRATFVGDESGGNRTVINGEAADFVLPNTKIEIQVSTKNFIIRNTVNDGHGLMPSYSVKPDIKEIIAGKDSAKEFVMDLIMKKL